MTKFFETLIFHFHLHVLTKITSSNVYGGTEDLYREKCYLPYYFRYI
jgi:hypothetical protein